MKHSNGNPILVTGAHRSGTTFLGKMLGLPTNIGEVFEPFSIRVGVKGFRYYNTYIKENHPEEQKYELLIKNILDGKASYRRLTSKPDDSIRQKLGRMFFKSGANVSYQKARYHPKINRYLVKDPIACMSSEWLHRKFNMDVVVLVRHPAAFVSSLKRLKWRFNFENFLNQRELMEDHLAELLDQKTFDNLPIAVEGSILWNCIYSVLFKYQERNPGFIVIRHEDLSYDPVNQLRELYNKLNIEYTDKIEQKIISYTSAENPTDPTKNKAHVLKRNSKENSSRWKKLLEDEEIKTIKEMTGSLASRFYTEDDW